MLIRWACFDIWVGALLSIDWDVIAVASSSGMLEENTTAICCCNEQSIDRTCFSEYGGFGGSLEIATGKLHARVFYCRIRLGVYRKAKRIKSSVCKYDS